MLISGTEPSSVNSRQTKWFKNLKYDVPKVPKQGEKGLCIKRTKLQFESILN